MARPLTYRRHGRHSRYDRVERRTNNQLVPGLGQDTQRFVDDQQSRLDAAEGAEGIFDSMMLEQEEDEFFTFEEVRAATDPTDIGLTPSVPAFNQTFSLDFDGGSESMGASGTSMVGIADTFSIAAWANFGNTTSRQDTLWTIEGGAGSNLALFQRTNVGAAPSYQVFGPNINRAFTSLPISSGVWHHVVFVWDTNAFVHLYIDGVDQLTSQGSHGGAHTDANRLVQVGDGSSGVPNGLMKCASMSIWPVRLAPAEIVTIFNAGSINIDLRVNQGNYTSAASLLHFWPLGKDPSPLLGQDLGFGTPIDLELGAVGMIDADRVADVP